MQWFWYQIDASIFDVTQFFMMYVLGVVLVLMFIIFIIVILQYMYASMRLNNFWFVATAYVGFTGLWLDPYWWLVTALWSCVLCSSWSACRGTATARSSWARTPTAATSSGAPPTPPSPRSKPSQHTVSRRQQRERCSEGESCVRRCTCTCIAV